MECYGDCKNRQPSKKDQKTLIPTTTSLAGIAVSGNVVVVVVQLRLPTRRRRRLLLSNHHRH
uniref:Uncharacterized protein n=1 Tax=Leersia perrieri TaxID=77586 RepID=A0A0D9XNE6_9ORYZ